MVFSLIVGSLGRTDEVGRLLRSLAESNYQNFEVIIVDQNGDDRLNAILKGFSSFKVIHLRTPAKGLSKARNLGLIHAKGEIVGFPDDDAWFQVDTLKTVMELFRAPEIDGVTGRCVDEKGDNSVINFPDRRKNLTIWNVWSTAVSTTIFLRRSVLPQGQIFNEELGLGAKYPAAEETELLLRLLRDKRNITFIPEIVLGHPSLANLSYEIMTKRTILYSKGIGHALRLAPVPYIYKFYF